MLHGSTKLTSFSKYALVLVVVHAGTLISLPFKQGYSTADIFLPSALSLILMFWLGPRYVLPMIYLNAAGSSFLWGHPVSEWPYWFVYALPEVVYPLLSWYLVSKLVEGKYWLPDLKATIKFLIYGIFIPAVAESILLQFIMVQRNKIEPSDFWGNVSSNLLSELTITFFLTLPFLYYLTPVLIRKGFISNPGHDITVPSLSKRQYIELIGVYLLLFVLVFFFNYSNYWFLYGFVSFYVALRSGFGPVLITNLYIVVLVYFLPRFFIDDPDSLIHSNALGKFLFAANSMFVFAVLASRVISDLRNTKAILESQFNELMRTNRELDKFVYSVSHDLTAPLKSILGLVAISELTNDPKDLRDCLEKTKKSVHKLERFIDQSLDYSRNNRQDLHKQPVDLKKICMEIIDDLKEESLGSMIDFHFVLREDVIFQDITRLRIVLKNLLSNAMKFQKAHESHRPYVKISSWKEHRKVIIEIEDNGEGIPGTEHQKIFNMFYRANARSQGSGLGLYIAKETVATMHGRIIVESNYGMGSKFTIELPA